MNACPYKFIGQGTVAVLNAASMYVEHGLPPIAGGQLDQDNQFIEACLFVRAEEINLKADDG